MHRGKRREQFSRYSITSVASAIVVALGLLSGEGDGAI
jgi:hypothetical protein